MKTILFCFIFSSILFSCKKVEECDGNCIEAKLYLGKQVCDYFLLSSDSLYGQGYMVTNDIQLNKYFWNQ